MYRKLLSPMIGILISLILTLSAWPVLSLAAGGTSVPGGSVSGTWTAAGSPYLVEGDITVPAGQTLNIEPGVQVIFQSWYQLAVNGSLLAQGTASAPILFTGADASTHWLGIRFYAGSDGSELTYAIVEQGQASGASPLDSGGGIYVENSSPAIRNATVRGNYAKRYGGGIYLTNSNATLIGNTIIGNQAGQGSSSAGGGIYMTDSNPVLTGNLIRGNRVYVSGSFSTPTGLGGGIYAYRSSPVLRYNTVSDNLVDANLNSHARGGGLYFYFGAPDLANNTVTGNSIPAAGSVMYDREGGGIYLYGSDLTVVNTILWNDAPQEIFVSDFGTLTVAYSDVQGGQPGIVVEGSPTVNDAGGNINADPLFLDAANGDYQLGAGSPAIDAGTAYFQWQGRVLVDLAPGEYIGAAPDMGALESANPGPANQPPVAVASANPASGEAPLTVQFSGDGSTDPDGTIVAYAWDFGDGSMSTATNPSHTYTNAGTYQATLIVTDDDGATDSAQVTIDVTSVTQAELHVGNQTVTRETYRRSARGVDVVLILDQNDQPVAGATVTVVYSGPNQSQVSGTTGSDGTVVLRTDWVRKPKGAWCFDVTDVAKEGYVYNSAANVVTVQCEAQ